MRKTISKHILMLAGVVCIAFAVLLIATTAGANKRCTQSVTAVLTEYRIDHNSENSTAYFPVVQYKAGNTQIEAVSNTGSGSRPYEIGETVSVRYNPDDPYEFVFEGDKSGTSWGLYLAIAGVALIALDVLTALGIIKESQKTYTTGGYSHHNHGNYGEGVTLNVTSISDAVKVAKAMKKNMKDIKNLSEEDRQALMDMMNGNLPADDAKRFGEGIEDEE